MKRIVLLLCGVIMLASCSTSVMGDITENKVSDDLSTYRWMIKTATGYDIFYVIDSLTYGTVLKVGSYDSSLGEPLSSEEKKDIKISITREGAKITKILINGKAYKTQTP